MTRFIEAKSRNQSTLLPEALDRYVSEDNSLPVVDVFIGLSDLGMPGFRVFQSESSRPPPAHHLAPFTKLYVHGYLDKIHSSQLLERAAQRNVELIWLIKRLMPIFKPHG